MRNERKCRRGPSASLATAVLLFGTGVGAARGEGVESTLTSYLQEREAAGFRGAVRVQRGSDVLVRDAYGPAEAELGVPALPEHVYRIGSLTKPLTATAVLRAVDRGAVGLESRLCGLLPTCPAGWEAVTVHHLLGHTSGIPDLFGHLDAVPVEDTAEEVERVLLGVTPEESLSAEPGREYSYSNFGYVLLGYGLERLSGTGWEEVLGREILRPLGMTATAYDDVWEIVPHRVRGYARRQDGWRHVEYDDHAAYAAGGLRSTVDDLARFTEAYFEPGRLLSAELLARALDPGPGAYGYGWQITERLGRTVVNHTGGIDGFASHLAHYPDDGLTVIVLSNDESEPAPATACDLAALVFEVDHVLTNRPILELAAEELGRWAGEYRAEGGDGFTLSATPEGLVFTRGGRETAYRPVASDLFVMEGRPDVTLTLRLDGGTVRAIQGVCGRELRRGVRGGS